LARISVLEHCAPINCRCESVEIPECEEGDVHQAIVAGNQLIRDDRQYRSP
jgi:hypothetical protein